jgi:hypothetical protein
VTNQNLKATSSTQQAAEELTTLAKRLTGVVAGYRSANRLRLVKKDDDELESRAQAA